MHYLSPNTIACGKAEDLMKRVPKQSVALSIWSPPYNIGKEYESGQSYPQWMEMMNSIIHQHKRILKDGGFMVVNINDMLFFEDKKMPPYHHENPSHQTSGVYKNMVQRMADEHPEYSIRQIARELGISHQTALRRLDRVQSDHNENRTRIELVGGFIQECAMQSGLYLYDRRIWKKDPAWNNSKWVNWSYRAVDEFEYLYIFWKPAKIEVKRSRLASEEWEQWGSRGVWEIPSVHKNDIHEAMFPVELPRRLIKLFSDVNDIVLDPFVGSGSTAIAAKHLCRRYIGFDKSQEYVALTLNALKHTKVADKESKEYNDMRVTEIDVDLRRRLKVKKVSL